MSAHRKEILEMAQSRSVVRRGRGVREDKLAMAERFVENKPEDTLSQARAGVLDGSGIGAGDLIEGGSLADILSFGKKAASFAAEHGPGALEAAKKGYKGLSEAYSAGKELSGLISKLRGRGYHADFLKGMQSEESESDEEKPKGGARSARGAQMRALMAKGMTFGEASKALAAAKRSAK